MARRCATQAFRRFERRRPAAPARRGVEIHRPARADARRQAAAPACRTPQRKRARRTPAPCSPRSRRAASCSSTACSRPNCPISPALEPGLTIRSMAQALAAGDPLVAGHLGKVVPTDDVAVALNTAFMDDGAVIHVAAGARARAADPSRLRQFRRAGGLGLHALAGRHRARRAGDAGREPRGPGRRRGLSGQRRARTRGRRRGPCRSRQGHRRGRRSAACLDADGLDRRACPLQRVPVHHRRIGGAQPVVRALRRRGRRSPASAARACSRAASTPT